MTPENIIMAAVDEVKYLDCTLASIEYPELYLDKVLRAIYTRLKDRSEAMVFLDDYLDKIRMEEHHFEAFLVPRIQKLYEALYHQLLDRRVYRNDGSLPYSYGGRESTRIVILSYEESN
jgi:hypothetical protein